MISLSLTEENIDNHDKCNLCNIRSLSVPAVMHSPFKLNISVHHGAAVLKNSNYFLLFSYVVKQEIKEGKICLLVC